MLCNLKLKQDESPPIARLPEWVTSNKSGVVVSKFDKQYIQTKVQKNGAEKYLRLTGDEDESPNACARGTAPSRCQIEQTKKGRMVADLGLCHLQTSGSGLPDGWPWSGDR